MIGRLIPPFARPLALSVRARFTSPIPPDVARSALVARLRAAAQVALDEPPAPQGSPERDAAAFLLALCERARSERSVAWLLLTALTAQLPLAETVQELMRRLVLDQPVKVAAWLVDHVLGQGAAGTSLTSGLRIVTNAALVDVDFSARTDHNTGIQRVVRSAVPHWVAEHSPDLVVWNEQ
ncbi:MAG: hypothetical protein FWF28_02030, partial [Micrococcales bacterium]|nr:hypothetical protein [Micrococcales bacterium]